MLHTLTAPNPTIEVNRAAPRIHLFPNPTQGWLGLRIDSAEPAKLGRLDYRVSTLNGQVVLAGSLRHWTDGQSTGIDFSGLPAGAYVLSVNKQGVVLS